MCKEDRFWLCRAPEGVRFSRRNLVACRRLARRRHRGRQSVDPSRRPKTHQHPFWRPICQQ